MTSNLTSIPMEARSLLRQAPCPECGKPGYGSDTGSCAWCDERDKVCLAILNIPSVETSGQRMADLERALVYSAFRQHATPQYMLPPKIILKDADTVEVLFSDGRSVEAAWPPRSPVEPAREHLHWCAVNIGKDCNCWCDHPRSELLARKGDAFEMRKCLECTKIFRVRLPEKASGVSTEPCGCSRRAEGFKVWCGKHWAERGSENGSAEPT